jgi:hypothetical protein
VSNVFGYQDSCFAMCYKIFCFSSLLCWTSTASFPVGLRTTKQSPPYYVTVVRVGVLVSSLNTVRTVIVIVIVIGGFRV